MITVKATGFEALERDIARREAELVKGAGHAMFAIARDGAARMIDAMNASGSPSMPGGAPGIVTGNLVKSVQAEYREGDLHAVTRFGSKGGKRNGAPHWHLLEFGTSKMAARPVMRPQCRAAAEAAQSGIKSLMGKA